MWIHTEERQIWIEPETYLLFPFGSLAGPVSLSLYKKTGLLPASGLQSHPLSNRVTCPGHSIPLFHLCSDIPSSFLIIGSNIAGQSLLYQNIGLYLLQTYFFFHQTTTFMACQSSWASQDGGGDMRPTLTSLKWSESFSFGSPIRSYEGKSQ